MPTICLLLTLALVWREVSFWLLSFLVPQYISPFSAFSCLMSLSWDLKHRFYSGEYCGKLSMYAFLHFVFVYVACMCVHVCMCLNASRYHDLSNASLELNVRVITRICDSPLSFLCFLCSCMQPANHESTVCKDTHTHTPGRTQEWDIPFGKTTHPHISCHKMNCRYITSYQTPTTQWIRPQVWTHTNISILLFEDF